MRNTRVKYSKLPEFPFNTTLTFKKLGDGIESVTLQYIALCIYEMKG